MPRLHAASNRAAPVPGKPGLRWVSFLLLACMALAPAADAAEQPITAVEVSSRVAREGRDLRSSIRQSVEQNLRRVDWTSAADRGPFILTTSLVRLDTSSSSDATRVSCTVSMTLRERKHGKLRAMLEGRGHVESSPGAAATAEAEAMNAAVRGAVKGLPEAIRRSR